MRFAKYDNPLGEVTTAPLLKPNLREGENIIDLAVANMLKTERVKGESRALTYREIADLLKVSISTIRRWSGEDVF